MVITSFHTFSSPTLAMHCFCFAILKHTNSQVQEQSQVFNPAVMIFFASIQPGRFGSCPKDCPSCCYHVFFFMVFSSNYRFFPSTLYNSSSRLGRFPPINPCFFHGFSLVFPWFLWCFLPGSPVVSPKNHGTFRDSSAASRRRSTWRSPQRTRKAF